MITIEDIELALKKLDEYFDEYPKKRIAPTVIAQGQYDNLPCELKEVIDNDELYVVGELLIENDKQCYKEPEPPEDGPKWFTRFK